jgi:hypothetical protein
VEFEVSAGLTYGELWSGVQSREGRRTNGLPMNWPVEVCGIPPFRQEKVERMGHGSFWGAGACSFLEVTHARVWLHRVSVCDHVQGDDGED